MFKKWSKSNTKRVHNGELSTQCVIRGMRDMRDDGYVIKYRARQWGMYPPPLTKILYLIQLQGHYTHSKSLDR